jgi:hypothetical protein
MVNTHPQKCNLYSFLVFQGDKGYCYVPYQYLIEKRLVSTTDAFWAIPEIIPRSMMRRGYVSYPNFTEYHQQYMLSHKFQTNSEQHVRRRFRRRRHY